MSTAILTCAHVTFVQSLNSQLGYMLVEQLIWQFV